MERLEKFTFENLLLNISWLKTLMKRRLKVAWCSRTSPASLETVLLPKRQVRSGCTIVTRRSFKRIITSPNYFLKFDIFNSIYKWLILRLEGCLPPLLPHNCPKVNSCRKRNKNWIPIRKRKFKQSRCHFRENLKKCAKLPVASFDHYAPPIVVASEVLTRVCCNS